MSEEIKTLRDRLTLLVLLLLVTALFLHWPSAVFGLLIWVIGVLCGMLDREYRTETGDES